MIPVIAKLWRHRRWHALIALLVLSGAWEWNVVAGDAATRGTSRTNRLRGAPIRPLNSSKAAPTNAVPTITLRYDEPERMQNGFLRMGFGKLSGYKYELYEVDSGPGGGRPFLKSDDTIPDDVKAYDGRRVSIPGFLLPMRIKGGRVTEFLLLRDQGTCCFGAQAQINHFIRVKMSGPGIDPDLKKPYRVSGTLHVGESYVQGYLTGIYFMDGEKVVEEPIP